MSKRANKSSALTPQQKSALDVEIAKVRNTLKSEIKKVKQGKIPPTAKALLANFSLPADAPALRIGSAFGSDPTALANLRSRESVVFPTTGLTNEISETNHLSFMFRDPLRNLVHVHGITALTVVDYESAFQMKVNDGSGEWFPEYAGPFLRSVNDTSNLHGDAMFMGVLGESDPYRGFHVSNGFKVTVTFYSFAPAWVTTLFVDLYVLEGKSWQLYRTGTITPPAPGAVIFTSLPTGYYAIKARFGPFNITAGGALTVAGLVSVSNVNSLGMAWAHKAAPQISGFRDNIETFCTLGSSLMYTNTASPLNRQGKLLARELPAKTMWHNFIDFDAVANQSLALVKDAPEGLYAFIRPSGNEVGQFRTLQYNTGNLVGTYDDEFLFTLYPEEPYVLIHAQITTAAGRDAYLTRCISMEYTSLAMFIEQAKGVVSEDDLKIALKLLAELPQFHDNPFHFSDVWDWIKDTAKDVWGAVKDVAPIAMAAAPLLL